MMKQIKCPRAPCRPFSVTSTAPRVSSILAFKHCLLFKLRFTHLTPRLSSLIVFGDMADSQTEAQKLRE